MACKYCEKRGKDRNGSDAHCAFDNEDYVGIFVDNWNCATMNILREEAEKHITSYVEDQRYAVIRLEDGVLFMSWYKNRGRTDAALFVDVEGESSPLSVDRAERLADHFRKVNNGY